MVSGELFRWPQRTTTVGAAVVGGILAAGLFIETAMAGAGPSDAVETIPRETPFVKRPFNVVLGDEWIGNGISYGPHRDGQRPGGPAPSREELREDLQLIREHWRLLRMYSARDASEEVLQLIRDERLGLKVMLGAWIGTEVKLAEDGTVVERFPETVAANRAEVATVIRLANAYTDIVIAITVGNETHVSWSFHKVQTDTLVNYIRQVRAATKVPVTTADDFSYWNKSESKVVAAEVDFIVMHAYAMWNKQPFANAMPFTRQKYAEVVAAHPSHQIVIGEAGWATQKHNQGDQSWLIVGQPGEDRQKLFHDAFTAWTKQERIPNFFFEAFDENWKGGPHPNEVEKHWGLFRADRTPKDAMQRED